ncbi:MAG: hypothetical protein ACO24P_00740 [Candidatus Nanopelagicaceae bacterium]
MARGKGFGNAIKGLNDIEKNLNVVAKLKGFQGTAKFNLKFDFDGIDDINKLIRQIDSLPSKIEEAHHKTMQVVALRLKEALDDAMNAEVWQWINDKRDIVDTGALRDSGRVSYNRSSQSISIIYGEEYAAIVHYGGYIKSGYNSDIQIYYPARPWIQATLMGGNGIPRFPFGAIYKSEFFKFFK